MAKKVIVIDDSVTIRQQVSVLLTAAGFQVVEAADGQEGLDVITSTTDAAMAICDINMPRMNGLEMLEQLAARKGPKLGLPILILTSEGQAQLAARAKQSGARGWMVKPFKPDQLLAAVKKLTAA